ncbi:unnamed protein product [Lymnaea stagnalis]|uniref:Glutaredoxin-like protein n=1 Tax=Lymnaea stagnalis TaxID=6523 RepID=A0AAV2HV94_LYMST
MALINGLYHHVLKQELWHVKRFAIMKIINTTNTKLSSHQIKRHFNDKSHLALPILMLYTKDPCPLCDEALEHLGPLLNQVTLQKVDITAPGNEDLWKAYRFDIPVFHLNGKFIMKHKADLSAFKTALKEYYSPKN